MTERFTEAQTLKLAEIYRDYECLWDVNSDWYKDRAARDAAYQKILDRLDIPGLTVKDIPKKIKNMRSSYYQELRKVQNSKRLGDAAVYKPKVCWFTTVEGFLKPFERIQISSRLFESAFRNYLHSDKDSNSASDNDFEIQNTEIENVTIDEEDLKRAEAESYVAGGEVDWALANHTSISVQTDPNETIPSYFILPSNKPNIKRRVDTMDEDIPSAIAKIDKIADRLTQSASSLIDKREDEFDSFGKYIAATLRTLPKELAIVGRTDIQKVISELQLRALRQNSSSLLPHSTIKLEHD